MDMASYDRYGGESSAIDHVGGQSSYHTRSSSFNPTSHPDRMANYDVSRSCVPKVTDPSPHNTMNHIENHNAISDPLTELITNLKIRIAVLENDLVHATKDKDEAIKSSVIIARALGNVANTPESTARKLTNTNSEELEELQVEVKRLKRENGMLWGRIESGEAGHMINYDNFASAGFKGKKIHQDPDQQFVHRRRQTHPTIDAAKKMNSERDEYKHSDHSADSDDEETQLPNTVNLKRLEDGSLAIPCGFPVLPSTPKKRNINDINNATLDDVLDSSEDEEPEIKIEDQLLYQERANADFLNVPAPAVLKAGFEHSPEKAVRGDDYANRGYANRINYYARFTNQNTNLPPGPRSFGFPPDLSEGTSIWATPQQRDEEINNHMRASDSRDQRFPDYFRYGIVYVPKEDDRDTLRGVHIGGLPSHVELRDVLARVRGGRIYSSVLVNTMGISGSNSALITFVNQADAEAYVAYANANPITFGAADPDEKNKIQAVVTHLLTPTFPFSPGKIKNIFELNRTRILTIRNFPHNLSLRMLESDLAGRYGLKEKNLLEWYIDEEGTLRMEFSSIDAAGGAFGMLTSYSRYRDARLFLQFEKDNCEGALKELEREPEKRRPMFPRTKIGARGDGRGIDGADGMGENSGEMVDSVLVMQRRRLAALQKQHDVIPSLRGEDLKSDSWADEVNEESGENAPIEAFERQNDEITSKNGKDANDTIRPEPHQAHSSTDSTSTLIGHALDAPQKDEESIANPATPKRGPRIITGKQWLAEIAAAKASSSSAPTSTPTLPPIPSTPSSNTSTPRPRLILSTTSLPPTVTTKSPVPSSAEYSIHSFASSAVSEGDDESQPLSFSQRPSQSQVQTKKQDVKPAHKTPVKNVPATFGGPLVSAPKSVQFQDENKKSSSPVKAHDTLKDTITTADTKVYFEPDQDTEKAILDSEVSSLGGGERDQIQNESTSTSLEGVLRGVDDVLEKTKLEGDGKMKMKINPDEIDLGLESDGEGGGEGDVDGDENKGLFQKELMTASGSKANAGTDTAGIDDKKVAISGSDGEVVGGENDGVREVKVVDA